MYLRLAASLLCTVAAASAWAQPPNAPSAIFVMNADGRNVRKVAQVDGHRAHAAPRWSHDGKRLVFTARREADRQQYCFVVNADGTGLGEVAKGRSADWSPDDRQIAFDSNADGPLAIYVQNLDGQGRVKISAGRSPRWSADGGLLAHSDGTMLYAVDLLSGEQTALLPARVASVFSGFAWSPDGRRLAVVTRPQAGGPRHLLFVDAQGNEGQRKPLIKGGMGGFISFSPDGKQLVFSNGWKIRIVEVDAKAPARMLSGQQGQNWHPAFSPDGKLIAFASSRKTAAPSAPKKAARPTAKTLEELRRHNKRTIVYSLDFTPDGRRVVMGGDPLNTGVQVWDLTTGETRELGGRGIHVSMFPDGRRFATAWLAPVAQIVDVESGKVLREIDHGGTIWALNVSHDGRRLLTGGTDKVIRIWDVETGEELLAFDPQDDWFTRAIFSPDGKEVITGGHDKKLRFWDAKTGRQRLAVEHPAALWGLAVTHDGRHVLTGTGGSLTSSLTALRIAEGPDNVLRMWDRKTGKLVREMKGHKGVVFSIDVSPDERLAVTGSSDGTMRLWDLSNGDELSKTGPGKGAVAYVGFSPDGNLIVAGGGVAWVGGRRVEFPKEQIRVYKVLDTPGQTTAEK